MGATTQIWAHRGADYLTTDARPQRIQECTDVAARMLDLNTYLKALLATPAIALCPLLCTFLDAVDAQSFRNHRRARTTAVAAKGVSANDVTVKAVTVKVVTVATVTADSSRELLVRELRLIRLGGQARRRYRGCNKWNGSAARESRRPATRLHRSRSRFCSVSQCVLCRLQQHEDGNSLACYPIPRLSPAVEVHKPCQSVILDVRSRGIYARWYIVTWMR